MSVATDNAFASAVSPAEFGIRVDDPIEHLRHCHERIERSLVIVQNAVASLRLTEPVLRTEAAAALDYELALLQLLTSLHTQDEERSLFPRLRTGLREDPDSMKEVMVVLESQHRREEAIFQDLAACVRKFPARPGPAADEQLDRLEGLVSQLADLYRPHMTLENTCVIDKCRAHLTPGDLDEMQKEMRLRFNVK
jgi:hemerythrin-like domain-containing protein